MEAMPTTIPLVKGARKMTSAAARARAEVHYLCAMGERIILLDKSFFS